MALGMSNYLKSKILNTFLRPQTVWPFAFEPYVHTLANQPGSLAPNMARSSCINSKGIDDFTKYPAAGLPAVSLDRQFQPTPVYVVLFGSDPGPDWTYDAAYTAHTKPQILAQVHAAHVRSGNNPDPLYIGNNSFGIWGKYYDKPEGSDGVPPLRTLMDNVPLGVSSYYDPQPPIGSFDSTALTGGVYLEEYGLRWTEVYAQNMVDLKFNDCPAATMTHVGIVDALSGGNLLYYGPLGQPVTTTLGQTMVIPAKSLKVYCNSTDVSFSWGKGSDVLAEGSPEWYVSTPTARFTGDWPGGLTGEFQRKLLGVTLCGGAQVNSAGQGIGTGMWSWMCGVSLDWTVGAVPMYPSGAQDVFCDVSGAPTIDTTAVLNVEVRVPVVNNWQVPYWYWPRHTDHNPGGMARSMVLSNFEIYWGSALGVNRFFYYPMFVIPLPSTKRLFFGSWLHLQPGDVTVTLR